MVKQDKNDNKNNNEYINTFSDPKKNKSGQRKSRKTEKGGRSPKSNNKKWKNFLLYTLIFLAVISLLMPFWNNNGQVQDITFSKFMDYVEEGKIQSVTIDNNRSQVTGKFSNGNDFKANIVGYEGFIQTLREQDVTIQVKPQESNMLLNVFIQILPFLFIIGLWFFIFRQAQGANNQALSFGKTRAKPWEAKVKPKITFKDLGGVDEAVEELEEIVEFLKTPEKFQALGAKIPKGVLLMGAPGTGKTLLARAVAGEADVSFFSLSGSDFVEMFVGVGASRVRDLFTQAKKNQPSIIFVDEIDAVGRQRGAGLGGGHDEREQTLNQLLVEMDGFEPNASVIVIAATNRPDILDPALQRPGRFDRQIVIDKPDIKGRRDILEIHSDNKKFDDDIDMEIIARRTPGFSGADLANLVNEATLLTARRDKNKIGMQELEESIDRVIAGPEKKSRIISSEEKNIIAYHEVGHALVAKLIPGSDPVHKISILPRGMALGYTLQLPETDKYLVPKKELLNQIMILLGGRIAEKIVFNDITSGASNDLKKATDVANKIVCDYGMSEKLGPRTFGRGHNQVFLGRDIQDKSKDYGDKTADEIDREIKFIFDDCYKRAEKLLLSHKEVLESVSKTLIDQEVIEGEEFDKILSDEIGHEKPEKEDKLEQPEAKNS